MATDDKVLREVVEEFRYQSSRPGVGERRLPPHVAEPLIAVLTPLLDAAKEEMRGRCKARALELADEMEKRSRGRGGQRALDRDKKLATVMRVVAGAVGDCALDAPEEEREGGASDNGTMGRSGTSQ